MMRALQYIDFHAPRLSESINCKLDTYADRGIGQRAGARPGASRLLHPFYLPVTSLSTWIYQAIKGVSE